MDVLPMVGIPIDRFPQHEILQEIVEQGANMDLNSERALDACFRQFVVLNELMVKRLESLVDNMHKILVRPNKRQRMRNVL